MHECFPKHLRMGTTILKYDNETGKMGEWMWSSVNLVQSRQSLTTVRLFHIIMRWQPNINYNKTTLLRSKTTFPYWGRAPSALIFTHVSSGIPLWILHCSVNEYREGKLPDSGVVLFWVSSLLGLLGVFKIIIMQGNIQGPQTIFYIWFELNVLLKLKCILYRYYMYNVYDIMLILFAFQFWDCWLAWHSVAAFSSECQAKFFKDMLQQLNKLQNFKFNYQIITKIYFIKLMPIYPC